MSTTAPDPQGQVLAECFALEYILLGDLRDLLEEPPDEQNRRWLREVLDALLDTVPREFALRQEGGYLEEVVQRQPNWCSQVDELLAEKPRLYATLRECRDQIARHASYTAVAAELRRELRDWISALVAHHRHERRLMQTAFNMEVGAGD